MMRFLACLVDLIMGRGSNNGPKDATRVHPDMHLTRKCIGLALQTYNTVPLLI